MKYPVKKEAEASKKEQWQERIIETIEVVESYVFLAMVISVPLIGIIGSAMALFGFLKN